MSSDAEFMLSILERGPATTMSILGASFAERECGLTVHSRAADLRRDGYDIRCRRVGQNHAGRPVYQYTLIQHPVQLELSA